MNQSWLVISSSSGYGLGSGIGASVLLFVVGQICLNYFFKWPFVVTGDEILCKSCPGVEVTLFYFMGEC